MSKRWPFSLLNDEQVSNRVGVKHLPEFFFFAGDWAKNCYLKIWAGKFEVFVCNELQVRRLLMAGDAHTKTHTPKICILKYCNASENKLTCELPCSQDVCWFSIWCKCAVLWAAKKGGLGVLFGYCWMVMQQFRGWSEFSMQLSSMHPKWCRIWASSSWESKVPPPLGHVYPQ